MSNDRSPWSQHMVVLVTCKNEEDPIKNEGARVVTTMLYYPSIFKILKGSSLLNR